MNPNPRLTDNFKTVQDMVVILAEGVPGALTVICELIKRAPECGLDHQLTQYTPIFAFDNLGLYGSKIWMLFNACERDIYKLLIVLTAFNLELLPEIAVRLAAETEKSDFDYLDLERRIKILISTFGKKD